MVLTSKGQNAIFNSLMEGHKKFGVRSSGGVLSSGGLLCVAIEPFLPFYLQRLATTCTWISVSFHTSERLPLKRLQIVRSNRTAASENTCKQQETRSRSKRALAGIILGTILNLEICLLLSGRLRSCVFQGDHSISDGPASSADFGQNM